MNAGIQGLAADIFKVALVRLDQALENEAAGQPRSILQVHDEVILEVPPDERGRRPSARPSTPCSGAADLDVPLEVNLAWGDTWAHAKG